MPATTPSPFTLDSGFIPDPPHDEGFIPDDAPEPRPGSKEWVDWRNHKATLLNSTIDAQQRKDKADTSTASSLTKLGDTFLDYTYRPLKHIFDVGGPKAIEEMGTGIKQNLDTYAQNPTGANFTKAVPLVGPPAYDIYNRVKTGDYPGAAGAVIGLGTSAFAPEIASDAAAATAGRMVRPIRAAAKPAVTAMKALDIPAGIAEQNGWMSRQVTRFLQNRALGREPMFNFLQNQNTAAQSAASRVGEGMGAPSTPIETGAAVGNILNTSDEAATQSLIDAEANRVNRINADAQAGPRGQEVFQRDIAGQQAAFSRERAGQQSQSVANLRDAAAAVGPPHSPEATGQAFSTGIQSNAEAFKSQARQLYSNVDKLTASGPQRLLPDGSSVPVTAIDTTPITKWMYQLHKDLTGLTGATAALKGQDVAKIMDMAKRFDSIPDFVTFRDGMDILSALKSIGRENSQLINSRYPGVIKKITNQMETQMQDAALRRGPATLAAYEKANAFYKDGIELFNESSVADLMDKNPEQIAQSLWRPNNVTPIKETQQALTGQPAAWQALQRRGLDDLFERSMKDGQLDPAKLQSEWSKLGPEVQQAMTGNRQHFDDLIAHNAQVHTPHDLDAAPTFTKPNQPSPVQPGAAKLQLTPPQQALRRIAQSRPESLAPQLLGANSESLWRDLRTATRDNPDLFDQARRQAFESLVAQHSGPPVAGGAAVLQSKALVRAWRDLGPHVQSFLAGDSLPQVNQLMSAVNALDTGKLNTMHNAIYGGLIDPSAGAFGINAAMHGDFNEAAATALFLIAPRYVAKAITSPAGIKWLTEGLELPAGTQAAAKWAARAGKTAVRTTQAVGVGSTMGNRKLPPPPLAPPPAQ